MVTAIGCYYECLRKANKARVLAVKAANSGRQQRAINLITAAQRYDQAAEGWYKNVPEWQWKVAEIENS